ncbi:hypothetical protein HK100_010004 [Physocladia obscura]|uniref:Uncharacterized protein n=1 Tax=Physocladia obscura TaxID=109957 RepID=A0AAD5T2S1_9FUNG|nr:hypothetical protein HK100_010004 [Physocladia obscura]
MPPHLNTTLSRELEKYHEAVSAIKSIDKSLPLEAQEIAKANIVASTRLLRNNNNKSEAHLVSVRKSNEKRTIIRKAILVPTLPLAELLLNKKNQVKSFFNTNSVLLSLLRNPSSVVSIDTAAGRSRKGIDLTHFSAYSHKSKRWLYGYKKGDGWAFKQWRAGTNSFNNPLFTMGPTTHHSTLDAKLVFVNWVDDCTLIEYAGCDSLRINSWLLLDNIGSLPFIDLGSKVCYSTYGHPSIFGPTGIVKIPDGVLTNIVKRLFTNHEHISILQPYLKDMSYEVAEAQPVSDPTVDAMRLFNLFYCLHEVLFLNQSAEDE